MMASTDHNPIVRRQLMIARIVGEENVAWTWEERSPHCRPDEVGFEAEKEVEDVDVEFCVERVVVYVVFHRPPAGEAGGFVVDEETAMLDDGLATVGLSGEGVDFVVFLGWGVEPEVETKILCQHHDQKSDPGTYGDCPACSVSV